MEKIKSSEIAKIIKNNTKYAIITGIILGVVGFFYSNFKNKNTYTAKASVMISENKGEDITYNSLMLNEKIANIYQELLNSNDLYLRVKEKLNLVTDQEDIKNSLKTDLNAQAGIITFELKSKGREESGRLLQSIIDQFKTDVNTYIGKDNVEYIQKVNVKSEGLSKPIKNGAFFGILGLVLSFFIIISKEFFSGKIKDPSYFDEYGLEVLGVIDEK